MSEPITQSTKVKAALPDSWLKFRTKETILLSFLELLDPDVEEITNWKEAEMTRHTQWRQTHPTDHVSDEEREAHWEELVKRPEKLTSISADQWPGLIKLLVEYHRALKAAANTEVNHPPTNFIQWQKTYRKDPSSTYLNILPLVLEAWRMRLETPPTFV